MTNQRNRGRIMGRRQEVSASRETGPTQHRRSRRLVASTAALSAVSLLAASGVAAAAHATSSPHRSTSKAGVAKLVFWDWSPGMSRAVALFNKTHPKIQVTLSDVGAGNPEYVKLAELKTGSLFAAAAACGAIAGRGTLKQVNASYQFGRNLGISFQIRDDILDIVGNEEATGKPLLKDLQNNASNMVLIHALSHADNYQKQSIHSMLYKKWFALQEIQALMKTLDQLGSIDHSNAVERNYAAAAKKALGALPASAARSKLEQLTEGLGSRTK